MLTVITPSNSSPVADLNQDDVLTTQERLEFVEIAQTQFGFSAEQAKSFMGLLSSEQVRYFIGLQAGEQNISRDKAQSVFRLSDEEVNSVFGDQQVIGVYNNSFGDSYIAFLNLMYTLGLGYKLQMKNLLVAQVESGKSAAEDRKSGAIGKFVMAMTAAAFTAGLALKNWHDAGPNAKGQRSETSPWTGPIGASLITQPINAIGEFTDQMYQYQAALHDVDAQQAGSLYQQMVSLLEGTDRESSKVAQSL